MLYLLFNQCKNIKYGIVLSRRTKQSIEYCWGKQWYRGELPLIIFEVIARASWFNAETIDFSILCLHWRITISRPMLKHWYRECSFLCSVVLEFLRLFHTAGVLIDNIFFIIYIALFYWELIFHFLWFFIKSNCCLMRILFHHICVCLDIFLKTCRLRWKKNEIKF